MIRAANARDFLRIAELDRTCWGDNRHSTYIPDGEHVWRIWCEHAIVAVAEIEGEISGAVLAFPCESGLYCLHKVFVDPAVRGGGVGIALMKHVLALADERGLTLFLTVDPDNAKALSLYRSVGFSRDRFVQGYYRKNEDRLVLTRLPRRSRI